VSLDIQTLRESFELVSEREPDFVARFYERLFSEHPEVKRLFQDTVGRRQRKMLHDALSAVMDNLENPTWLDENLRSLGEKHVGYGVEDHMYDWIGESLLGTIAEVANDAWTPDLERAWTHAFDAIAHLMKAGAAKAMS